LLARLAADGMGIIVISSELPEVKNGKLSGELSRTEASKERVMELAAG
jgi:ABC-type sugar transport system ATPase subunit